MNQEKDAAAARSEAVEADLILARSELQRINQGYFDSHVLRSNCSWFILCSGTQG